MSTMRVNLLFLVVANVSSACIDHECPKGYREEGDTCYRIRDAGLPEGGGAELDADVSTVEFDASVASDAPREASVARDAASDASDPSDAAGPPPADALPSQDANGFGAMEASTEGDSSAPVGIADASLEPRCEPTSCENGGMCTNGPSGFPCSCPTPYMGERCETKICTSLFLRTGEELAKARSCAEIQGDLTLVSAGIAEITESDLPYLTKITGHLSMTGLANNGVETPRLRELTLAKLREIGGSLRVAQTGSGSVTEIRFPALTRVGAGVFFGDTQTTRLDLPALRTVDGAFALASLKRLCTLDTGAIERISAGLQLLALFNLPASALEPLRRAYTGTPSAEGIGCCLPQDKNCISGLSSDDDVAFCGCSVP